MENSYPEALKRLRQIMILFKLGYGSREMNMAFINSRRQYSDAHIVFEKKLGDL